MNDFNASTGYFCLASKFLVQSSSLRFLAPQLGNTKHLDVVHISKFQSRRRSKAKVTAMNYTQTSDTGLFLPVKL